MLLYWSITIIDNIAGADLTILLGCCVKQSNEDQSRELIKIILEQKRSDAELIVSGCITKVRPELPEHDDELGELRREIYDLIELKRKYHTNFPGLSFWNNHKNLIKTTKSHMRQRTVSEYASYCTGYFRSIVQSYSGVIEHILSKYSDYMESRIDELNNRTYTIKICTGCCGSCSYCSIKQSRGEIQSIPIEKVMKNFEAGLNKNYKDFAFIGTDIGDYGKDLGTDLQYLLESMVKLPRHFRLRLRNVNPRWIVSHVPELCHLVESGKISYIQSPVQSCSNRTLKLMNRGYEADNFLEAMRKIRSAYPDIFLRTQIIVGFPGESNEEFQKALRLYKSRLFNYIDVFRYSNRPNTIASTLPDRVSPDIIMKRYVKLRTRSLYHLAPRQMLAQFKAKIIQRKPAS
jgi:MiaB/RimO family radical SAM methylthiotransferase